MIVIPAIDMLNGKVVRLTKGAYDQVTEYEALPHEYACRWRDAGASCIHLVDLTAAKTGTLSATDALKRIRAAVDTQLEYGGGVRSVAFAEELFALGIDRVVLGTAAFDDAVLTPLVKQYRDRIAVSVDARNGMVKVGGWCDDTALSAAELIKRLEDKGVAMIVFTDIDRDGMLAGPNIAALEAVLKQTTMQVIASGGISSLDDLAWFARAPYANLYGVITGKALYEGKLDLTEAIRLTKGVPL